MQIRSNLTIVSVDIQQNLEVGSIACLARHLMIEKSVNEPHYYKNAVQNGTGCE